MLIRKVIFTGVITAGVFALWQCERVYLPQAWMIPPVNHAPVYASELAAGVRAGVPSLQYKGDEAWGAGMWGSYNFATRLINVNFSLVATAGRYTPSSDTSGPRYLPFTYTVAGATSFAGLNPVVYPFTFEVGLYSGFLYDYEPESPENYNVLLPVWGTGIGIGFIDTATQLAANLRYVFLGVGTGLTAALRMKRLTIYGGTQLLSLGNGANGWIGIGIALPTSQRPRAARLEQ